MSNYSSLSQSTPSDNSAALCAPFEPLLPLLSLDKLDTAEANRVRAHVQGCEWCQQRLREYDTVLTAMRASLHADLAAGFTLRPEYIMQLGAQESSRLQPGNADDDDVPEADGAVATVVTTNARSSRRTYRAHRWTSWSTIAAALLVTLLTGALFVGRGLFLHGNRTPRTGTPAATALIRVQRLDIVTLPLTTAPVGLDPSSSDDEAVGKDGSLWYVSLGPLLGGTNGSTDGMSVVHVGSGGALTTIPLPIPTTSADPVGIAIGGDGMVWVGDRTTDTLWRVDPHTGAVQRFDIPEGTSTTPRLHHLAALTVGPDSTVFYTTDTGDVSGTGVGTGPDLWSLDPATGATTLLLTFGPETYIGIEQLAGVSAGVVWLVLYTLPRSGAVAQKHMIGRYDIKAHTLHTIDVTSIVATRPTAAITRLTPAPDGSAWWLIGSYAVRFGAHEVVHILANGTLTTYQIPGQGTAVPISGFAADASSNYVFLQDDGSVGGYSVVRLTPEGVFQTVTTVLEAEIDVPHLHSGLNIIGPGPGVTIWMVRLSSNVLGPDLKEYAVRIDLLA